MTLGDFYFSTIESEIKMKNILLLIDMQVGFTQDPVTNQLVHKTKELLDQQLFDAVIATQFVNAKNSIYEQLMNWTECSTEQEIAIRSELLPYATEVVTKTIYSCISPNFLQRLCQINDGVYPKKIFLAGVDTDSCVLKTAVDLFENNIRPIVLTDFCYSSGGQKFHDAGIVCMQRLLGEKQLIDGTNFNQKIINEF